MSFRYLLRTRGGSTRAFDTDVLTWEASVIANGGSVSLARRIIIDQFVFSLKSAGVWAKTADLGILAAENATQALTSLKGRVLGSVVNSPVFTANQDYTTDGTTSYVNLGVNPASTSEGFLGYWERTNTVTNTGGFAIGARNNATQAAMIRPKSGAQVATFALNSQADLSLNLPANTSKGFALINRTSAPVFEGFKDGVSLGTGTPTTVTSNAITYPLFVGGYNGAGTMTTPRGTSGSFWITGGTALTSAEQLALYNAILAALTSIGTTL